MVLTRVIKLATTLRHVRKPLQRVPPRDGNKNTWRPWKAEGIFMRASVWDPLETIVIKNLFVKFKKSTSRNRFNVTGRRSQGQYNFWVRERTVSIISTPSLLSCVISHKRWMTNQGHGQPSTHWREVTVWGGDSVFH